MKPHFTPAIGPPVLYHEAIDELKETKELLRFYRSRPPMTSPMIFWAFRYCLGRSTYAVMDCVDYLVLYWDRIPEVTRNLIVKEIFEACDKKDCGMEMDKSAWHRVLERAGVNVVFPELRKEGPCITNQCGSKL